MTIEADTRIWHYFDLAKYVGLLARGLFFALPSALRRADPWEGSWGEHDFVESLDTTVHAKPDGVAQWQAALRARHTTQDAFGVSCWHASPTESGALWRLYVPLGLGVAISSTPAKLQAALGDRRVETRPIDYRGHKGRRLGDDPLVLLSTKRPEFQHEREVRVFVNLTDDERTVLTSFYGDLEEHGVYRLIKPGNRGPLLTPGAAFSVRDSTCVDRGAPAGIHIPTDVGSLIDRVHLAPACTYPLRRAVLDVTERFGLDRRVITEAEFDLAPFDRVKFV